MTYAFAWYLIRRCFPVFVVVLLFNKGIGAQTTDWLLDDRSYKAEIKQEAEDIILSNGLVSRTFRLNPNLATIAFENLVSGESVIRGIKPEAEVTLNHVTYPVGGLVGQPNYAFLVKEWIEQMTSDSDAFRFISYETGVPAAPFSWHRKRAAPTDAVWPPKGVYLKLDFAHTDPEISNLVISVHYELYDGLPVFCKWISVVNNGDKEVVINNYSSEILAAVEYSVSVDTRNSNVPKANLHVETDYAFGSMDADDANAHIVHWLPDPDYLTQVNYLRNNPCLLKVSPEVGPEFTLIPNDTFTSHRTFILPYDSYDRERQGLSRRRMYRKLAPWTLENPLMMHVRYADWESVKSAIDQASDVGFEMLILTFGSGFNIENDSPEYLTEMKRYAEYAKSKNLEIGGYSLLASRTIDADNDVLLPDSLTPVFGHSPCLGSSWAHDYFSRLYNFYRVTGFSLLEHDGSYPGDVCYSTHHPGHRGYADSRWNQYQIISEFYQWCRSQGIFLNIPDYYYLTGGNKCGMGYRETNWSLPRSQQVIHTRQNIYDGTWTKLVTMGWMFVPLTEYHGGGEAATIEPLNEHLDHYQQMMMSNLGAGVQACYRGPRLYDTEETKNMVKATVDFYKRHRSVLEGDLIHLKRADGAGLDYWLMVDPGGHEKAALVVFNPTNSQIEKSITVPFYYTGLADTVRIYRDDVFAKEKVLNRKYEVLLNVSVPAEKWDIYFFR
ncbi:MAG: alpha-galactosidase [Saprospiraceae bacterium]|nr:alpha-galactosidase [Saprospiraceae bacterium]